MITNIDFRKIQSYETSSNASTVSIIEVEDDISASCELLKILLKHNQQQNWTLLLAPDLVPSKDLLDSCSIDRSKLLVIRERHLTDTAHILKSALSNGNFGAIIGYTNILRAQMLDKLSFEITNSGTKVYSLQQASTPSFNNTQVLC